MDRVNRVAPIGKIDWKITFNLAVGIHILFLAGAIYLPQILKSKPKHVEIYSVDLVNYVAPAPAPAAPAPVQPVKAITPKTEARKTAPIAEAPTPTVPVPEKVISLKPIKKKVTKVMPPKPDLDRQRRVVEAKKAQQAAAEAARLAQQEAELQRRLLEADLAEARQIAAQINATNTPSTGVSKKAGGGSNLTGAEAQFLNAIKIHIHQYWQLPAIKSWDPSLTTRVAIIFNSNGHIRNITIEESSGDNVFDQYVRKALQDADPLPKIPPVLKKTVFDIGFVFKPGLIQ